MIDCCIAHDEFLFTAKFRHLIRRRDFVNVKKLVSLAPSQSFPEKETHGLRSDAVPKFSSFGEEPHF